VKNINQIEEDSREELKNPLEVFLQVEGMRVLLSSVAGISLDVVLPGNSSLGVFSYLLLEEVCRKEQREKGWSEMRFF